MSGLTSVIMTSYIQEPFQAHMTMAALANITRYTDPSEYELILMSDSEKYPVRDDYRVLKIDRYERTEGLSYTQSMNKAVEYASGEYLCFIQNDVFVFGDWLEDLKEYLIRDLADCVVPDQVPRSFAEIESFRDLTYENAMFGSRDEGLMFMTRAAYEKMGGFNEKLSILQGKDTWDRMAEAGVRQVDTVKVIISHIMAATNLSQLYRDPKGYDRRMRTDQEVLDAS